MNLSHEKLIEAVKTGNLESIRFLVACGVDAREDGDWALHAAAEGGHTEVVRFLLGLVDKNDPNGVMADVLRSAARNGHPEVVRLLVEMGADPHSVDQRSMQNAFEKGHLETVRFLMESRGVRIKDDQALQLAVYDEKILTFLMGRLTKTGMAPVIEVDGEQVVIRVPLPLERNGGSLRDGNDVFVKAENLGLEVVNDADGSPLVYVNFTNNYTLSVESVNSPYKSPVLKPKSIDYGDGILVPLGFKIEEVTDNYVVRLVTRHSMDLTSGVSFRILEFKGNNLVRVDYGYHEY